MRATAPARYRVGATSFVTPAGWLENARRLAGRVADVALLLCEDPRRPGCAPDAAEVDGLAELARTTGLGYTVHAPCETSLADADRGRREDAVAQVLHATERVARLEPRAFVVHLDRPASASGGAARWREDARRSLDSLIAGGLSPDRICVETLDARFDVVAEVVEAAGVAVALDLGHFADAPAEAERLVARHLWHSPIIHWHGKVGPRDHRSLRHFPRAAARRILGALHAARWDGVLTLEVFGEEELADSLATLRELEGEVPT